LLGAASLFRGYHPTTHWMFLELLRSLGTEPVSERDIVNRNRITGGGDTTGIDFAPTIAAELFEEEIACKIRLSIEYGPALPFVDGSPTPVPIRAVEQPPETKRSSGSHYEHGKNVVFSRRLRCFG
jgi:cyclohexyl-isocyanide hydratase